MSSSSVKPDNERYLNRATGYTDDTDLCICGVKPIAHSSGKPVSWPGFPVSG
jgi:hypothetical protein